MKKYRFLTPPYKRNLGARAASVSALFLVTAAHAVDSTWLPAPPTNDWNDYNNWSPLQAPENPGDTASFNNSNITAPTLSDDVTINSITFNPGASAFTIANGFSLTLQGAGIVNNSGIAQVINNEVVVVDGVPFTGATVFENASSAGNAVINNVGAGTSTQFQGNSTAGNATITNSGAGSFTVFGPPVEGPLSTATAANATIINSGINSFTTFNQATSGGNAALINANPTAFISIAELDTAGTTVGSIAGDGTIYLGSKNLTIGGNQQSTVFSGVIADGRAPLPPELLTGAGPFTGGSLTKIGNGTLTLTGLNTYTGGTNLNGGILAVDSDSNLGTGPLSFNGGTLQALATGGGITSSKSITLGAGGGTFLADAGTASTLSGIVSGAGTWTKSGPGLLALSAANTYTGGTIISGGTLLTQNASALGTGPLTIGNGATLQVQDLLNVNGNWTVPSGTATVSGGTVQTVGDFNLGGGGVLVANSNFNVAGAANISSSGFVVNSVFTVNDNVNLSASTQAIINGALTTPNVNVGQNARLTVLGRVNGNVANVGLLEGRGLVNGNVFNGGTVSPGTSIGTLTINGNYTQNANGTLRIEVAGTSPGQFDVLAVNGHASLAGTLQLVRLGNFNLSVGDRIAFLTATGGVSGTFPNVQNDFLTTGSAVLLDVIYLPNAAVLGATQGVVILQAVQGSFADFAAAFCGTPNSIAVGQALDSAVGDARAAKLISFLNQQSLTDLCNDIDLISPEQLTSIFVIGTSLANVQSANLERRMDDIQAGSTGFNSSGFSINGSGPSFSEGFAGVSGPEGKSGQAVFAPVPDNHWGVFVTGLGEFTNVESTFNASGYDLATGGFTMGVDYRIGSHFAIGLTGGYAYTAADLVNNSNIAVNGGKLGTYATVFGSGFYLDTAVVGGLNGYDTNRTALEGTARGRTTGGDLNVLLAGGYDWKKGGFSIGPTASFQYTLIGFGAFTESGSLAPLAYPAQNAQSYRTALGMKTSYDWKIGPVHLVPELRLAWQHEFGQTDYSLVSSFANGAGNSFTVTGAEIGRDSMLIGTGFAVHWNDRWSTYAYYDGELFRTNYLSNNISAGFRLSF